MGRQQQSGKNPYLVTSRGSSSLSNYSSWQQGQQIPCSVPESPSHGFVDSSVVEVLQTLKSSLDGQFSKINLNLGEISERLLALESRQKALEEKVEAGCSSNSLVLTPQSSRSESGAQRRRRTPVALQVYTMRCLYIV